jgi:glutathione synthase/RimK-type ligase-like ATP-grasp enzyme
VAKNIIILTDYKGHFGSKHFDIPYRSGMDKSLLKAAFLKYNFEVKYIALSEVKINDLDKDDCILYTSSEDIGYSYKDYIEDKVLILEESGFNVLPKYRYLRANNNKVFMEELRRLLYADSGFFAQSFGTLEELVQIKNSLSFPLVLKVSEGASGEGVFLAKNFNELVSQIKKHRSTFDFKLRLKDIVRTYKHKGYIQESQTRKKFIIQPFIPELKHDWKVYIFYDEYYVFKRPIQKGRGIKASGGGYDNYYYGEKADVSDALLNFAKNIFKKLNTPHCSIDIAFDGNTYYLIEFQCLYFGTAGILYSDGCFINNEDKWQFVNSKKKIEDVYVESVVKFLKNK